MYIHTSYILIHHSIDVLEFSIQDLGGLGFELAPNIFDDIRLCFGQIKSIRETGHHVSVLARAHAHCCCPLLGGRPPPYP